MRKYMVSQPAITLCIESRSSKLATTTSAPRSRNACARSSSFRTIARTALPCFNSSLVIVRPTPPTRPAPVTRMGFAMFFLLCVHLNRKPDWLNANVNRVKCSVRVGSVCHRLLPPRQKVPVWTRRWGEIPQPSDEYALRAVRPYTVPSHTSSPARPELLHRLRSQESQHPESVLFPHQQRF